MTNQTLKNKYKSIEYERKELKQTWVLLKNTGGDKEEIKRIGTELTKLTLNQAHILRDLERKL